MTLDRAVSHVKARKVRMGVGWLNLDNPTVIKAQE